MHHSSRFISILSSSWSPDTVTFRTVWTFMVKYTYIRSLHAWCLSVASHWLTFPFSSLICRIYLVLGNTPVLVGISFLSNGGRMFYHRELTVDRRLLHHVPLALIKLSSRCQSLPTISKRLWKRILLTLKCPSCHWTFFSTCCAIFFNNPGERTKPFCLLRF